MPVPSRAELGSPSDLKPLLPTTFPLYERYFHEEPPLFYVSEVMPPLKVAYLENFWRREFPGIYPALLNAGLFEKGERNIGRHNIMAGIYAHDLAYLSGLGTRALQRVATAAGVHDFGKPHENKLLRTTTSPQAILQALERSKIDDRDNLEAMGYSPEVIALVGANVPKKPEIRRRRDTTQQPPLDSVARTIVKDMSFEEQIIWYVDAMLLDTMPVDLETRFSVTSSTTTTPSTERETRNQAVRKALSDYYGVDYHALQLAIGGHIEKSLAQRIKENHPELYYLNEGYNKIPFFLQTRLDHRVDDWVNRSTPTPLLQVALS